MKTDVEPMSVATAEVLLDTFMGEALARWTGDTPWSLCTRGRRCKTEAYRGEKRIATRPRGYIFTRELRDVNGFLDTR